MAGDSSSDAGSDRSSSGLLTSPPSSPPPAEAPVTSKMDSLTLPLDEQHAIEEEEEKARTANEKEEARRIAALRKKRKKAETKAEREAKARELDELLLQSAAFSDILTKKTQVLGRVGSGFDGKALGEHDLRLASQPKCLVGGTMRDYQLEGLTWMEEICLQNMSGILADEMGLGEFNLDPPKKVPDVLADEMQAKPSRQSPSSPCCESGRATSARTLLWLPLAPCRTGSQNSRCGRRPYQF